MTKESLSFKEYIQNYSSDNITTFNNIFDNRLHKMSNTSSSKKLMQDLCVSTNIEFIVFRKTYLDFYKKRLNEIQD